jgi:NAD-dependent SIR2 family protein deacetylase
MEARSDIQIRLQQSNPGWNASIADFAPDGDSRVTVNDFEAFIVPDCHRCGGILKPDVVFFGEPVPADRVRKATDLLRQSDALMVVGSSLMVYSGYRFVRMAKSCGLPIAVVNRGATRADPIATYKLAGDCCTLLAAAVSDLGAC